MLLPPVAGCDAAEASPLPTTPTAGQAIPLLTHTPCYSTTTAASHRSELVPSYSSMRGNPLPRLPRLRVVPFLGLTVVHRPGALDAAWSTWSRNGFHRTWTVRGEDDSWVHGRSKEVPPYYVQIIIPPPNSGDPPDGPPYFMKKTFPPDCWDPPATSSHARKCLTVGTHPVEAYVALSFWSRTCTYILVNWSVCRLQR